MCVCSRRRAIVYLLIESPALQYPAPPTRRPTMTLSRILSLSAVLTLTAAAAPAAAAQATGGAPPAGATQPPLSPRDSLNATISGAEISVNYGRPSKRGRDVFGGLADMKWGMVWRLGANEATGFITTKPLAFGIVVVPAGKYTLFMKLVEGGHWELIVNKQTGQSGTEYDAAQDLVRIPVTVTTLPAAVEKMELAVKPAGKGGEWSMQWDKTRAAVAFTVK